MILHSIFCSMHHIDMRISYWLLTQPALTYLQNVITADLVISLHRNEKYWIQLSESHFFLNHQNSTISMEKFHSAQDWKTIKSAWIKHFKEWWKVYRPIWFQSISNWPDGLSVVVPLINYLREKVHLIRTVFLEHTLMVQWRSIRCH